MSDCEDEYCSQCGKPSMFCKCSNDDETADIKLNAVLVARALSSEYMVRGYVV
jgi:hypothetical protein